jgi:hypothetical protein
MKRGEQEAAEVSETTERKTAEPEVAASEEEK